MQLIPPPRWWKPKYWRVLTLIVGAIAMLDSASFWFGRKPDFNPWLNITCGMAAIELAVLKLTDKT